jgi:hypothetical protein
MRVVVAALGSGNVGGFEAMSVAVAAPSLSLSI